MKITLPKPASNETLLQFQERAMVDQNLLREYPNYERRLEVVYARYQETQLSGDFYIEESETPTESLVSDPNDSKGKTIPDRGEPVTDGETQKKL